MAGLLDYEGLYNDGLLDPFEAAALRQRQSVMAGRRQGQASEIMDQLVPHLAQKAIDAAAVPGRVFAGELPMVDESGRTSPEAIKGAHDLASFAMTGGLPMAPKGAAGIFGGRLAQTADHEALARAEKMAADGADRQAIWNDTGWFKGADNKWRFEIPDNASDIHATGLNNLKRDRGQPMSSLVSHDELYRAYPELKAIEAVPENGSRGVYRPGISESDSFLLNELRQPSPAKNEQIGLNPHTSTPVKSIALHELQHAISPREGFVGGGDHKTYFVYSDPQVMPLREQRTRLENAYEAERLKPSPDAQRLQRIESDIYDLEPAIERAAGMAGYKRLAGEVEARNVQTRRDMTPDERKATPPWATQDVPDEQQIVRFGIGPQMSIEDLLARYGR